MKRWLIICGPNAGFMDACLPVLSRLREVCPGEEVLCLFPSVKTATDFSRVDSSITELSEEIIDGYFWPVGQDLWAKCSSLEELREITARMSRVDRWCGRWLFPQWVKSRILVQRQFALIEELVKRNALGRHRAMPTHLHGVRAVLADVVVLRSPERANFQSLLYWYRSIKDVPHFHLNHGLYVIRDKHAHRRKGMFRIHPARSLWFINDDTEIDACVSTYGFRTEDLRVVGIPRHDESWMDEIIRRELARSAWSKTGHVLLISRPAGDGALPRARKQQFLEWIYRVVCEQRGLELVVKRHPKEADHDVFDKALGAHLYGSDWSFADNHPFVLGKEAVFVIAFWSGVCADMIRLGKPTIEVNDVRGLEFFDNPQGFRDQEGRAITEYEYYGLVRPAHSEVQLREEVDRALAKDNEVLAGLKANYKRHFKTVPDVARNVAHEILENAL